MATIGDYEIGDELGQGPLGKVYRATHIPTSELVVFRGFTKPADAEESLWQHCIQRYTEELEKAKELKHPNIAEVYDFGAIEEIYWVASEFFTGRTLVRVLDEEGAKDTDFVIDLYAQLGSAMDYALERGLTHTDLTPFNILFTEGAVVKLINFGLGHIREKWGSPYAAPEQIRSEAPDARTDVFGFGVIGYECLAGDSPFIRSDDDATAAAVLADDPKPIDSLEGPPNAVLLKMLDKEPANRYETCGAAAKAFEEAVKSDVAPDVAGVEPVPHRTGRKVDTRPSLANYDLQESDARSAIESLRARLTK